MLGAQLVDEPVRRRPGVELDAVWDVLRQHVEGVSGDLVVTVQVRKERLDRFLHAWAQELDPPTQPENTHEDWVPITLRFSGLEATRSLLPWAPEVEALSPPEVRNELATVAAEASRIYPT